MVLKEVALSKSSFKIPNFRVDGYLILESLEKIPFEMRYYHFCKETIAEVLRNFPKVVMNFL